MRKSFIVGAGAVLAVAGIAAAQTSPPPPLVMATAVPLAHLPPQVPPNLEAREIPDVLLSQIGNRTTIERYVASVVGQLRSADRNGDGLDRGDIELAREIRLAQSRAQMVGQVLRYDLDGDFVVTRKELEQSFGNAENTSYSGVDYELKQFDRNHDGRITLAEAAQAQPNVSIEDSTADSLLALDPNGDGRLMPAELQAMAEHAFKIVDRDGDGTISKDEDAAIAEQRSLAQWLRTRPRCTMPAVPEGARTVAYGEYAGAAISSAAIGGQDQETNLTDVVIEPGSQPLYLVLSSYESMAWRVEGDTGRVIEAVVHSFQRSEPTGPERISASGVIGLPASKVTIQGAGCLESFYRPDDAQAQRSLALLARSLGRKPDAVFGSYSAQSVSLPSGAVAAAIRDNVPAPAGFDPQTWPDATRFWPAGLVNVAPATVVANTKVERYEVLPSQMGLSQLVGSGAAQYVSSGKFRIVKSIPHLPPRMTGAHLATLILARGVPLPPGDPGHSCVISEETGQPVVKGPLCPSELR